MCLCSGCGQDRHNCNNGCGQDISGIVQSEAMVTVRTTQREGIPLLTC